MSHGNEASASAIDDVIAEAVRELELEEKVGWPRPTSGASSAMG
jgi:hypothetical protein